jgi:site-specific recombinase XerD
MIHDPSLPDCVQAWLDDLKRQGKSSQTWTAYRRAVQHFAAWSQQAYGEQFDPARIIARDVRDWKAYQQKVEKAAPRTINQRLVGLSRFFAWAITSGAARVDPTEGVTYIPLPTRQPRSVPAAVLRKLLRTVHRSGQLRDIALLEVLAGTGLRVGELLGLQVGDVTLGDRTGQVTVRRGKQGNFREVPLTKEVRQALRNYLQTHPGKEEVNAPLWLGTQGALQHRSSVLRVLNKYALQAGLPAIHPHALRHTFATRYLEHNPDDLRGLAALLGHTSLDTVMIYTEPSLEALTERMEKMEMAGD